ncbi:hypothetical protein J6590_063614 [Homalodisca vitripennis]|nr:hypothetical protein J6590_063614 [Homalodisca vitripennis]
MKIRCYAHLSDCSLGGNTGSAITSPSCEEGSNDQCHNSKSDISTCVHVADCTITVHQNSCKEHILECSKSKVSKSSAVAITTLDSQDKGRVTDS